MRNVLLIGVSVLALGIGSAAADQSTTVNDTSEGSVNDITQSASGTGSMITVTQTGEGGNSPGTVNAAEGTNVFIDQTSDDDSTIDVAQDGQGDGNSIFIDQEALSGPSMVMATQIGELNQADIMQTATDSDITLLQNGEGNAAAVDQMANENTANVGQWGEMNTVSVVQGGDGNDVDIDQGADGAAVEMNTAEAFQYGTESFVVISQLGSENMASATQNMDVSDGATIMINQDGTGGSTTIVQN